MPELECLDAESEAALGSKVPLDKLARSAETWAHQLESDEGRAKGWSLLVATESYDHRDEPDEPGGESQIVGRPELGKRYLLGYGFAGLELW